MDSLSYSDIAVPGSISWLESAFGTQNIYSGSFNPSTLHMASALMIYNLRYLTQQALSVFKWKLPESLERNYFLYSLYYIGYGFVFNTEEFGTIYQTGGLSDYDIYYNPAYALVNNKLLPQGKYNKMRIGEECAVIRLSPDYCGIFDLIKHYADLLTEAESALKVNLFNTKFAYIFYAEDDAKIETLKKMYDEIMSGNPAVFTSKKSLYDEMGNRRIELFNQDVKSVYIADKLLENIRGILNEFHTKIGIPNANTEKKERLITDEANANNFETRALCYGWFDMLKKDIDKSNAMFPDFKIRIDWREENATIHENNTADGVQ